MKGVNLVILLGRLGADPEVKNLPNGATVATFNLATSEVWVDKEGQKKERTEWHSIVVWGKLAGVVGKYLKKGAEAHIQGKLSTRSWEDKETGQKRYKTEIVANQVQFVGGNKNRQSGESNGGDQSGHFDEQPDFEQPSSDEIPF